MVVFLVVILEDVISIIDENGFCIKVQIKIDLLFYYFKRLECIKGKLVVF